VGQHRDVVGEDWLGHRRHRRRRRRCVLRHTAGDRIGVDSPSHKALVELNGFIAAALLGAQEGFEAPWREVLGGIVVVSHLVRVFLIGVVWGDGER
jgi:hypothetical protein